MSFKLLPLFFILVGCGLKGDPSSPKSPPLPSLLENYPDIKLEKPLEDNTRKK